MAGSKHKEVKQKEIPTGKRIAQGGNPEQYYSQYPVWSFASIDSEKWTFSKEHLGTNFWDEVLPRLKDLESQTWREILIIAKKQNHSIDVNSLNKDARIRLSEKYIEAESLVSLRLNGTHRLYGYMTGRVFNILWYDDDHGDNDTCVCRSHKKHT